MELPVGSHAECLCCAPRRRAIVYKLQCGVYFDRFSRQMGGSIFCDTLDFIFCSEKVEILDTVPTPSCREDVAGPFPNEKEASDHLLIGASISVPVFEVETN